MADGRRHRATGMTIFHFRGERICDVGVRTNLVGMRELVRVQAG